MGKNDISIAVMQPYIFPYLGYFQLVKEVDKFIVYDVVQYINRGYINRNKILINGESKFFNFQIHKEDQFKKICEVRLKFFLKARQKLLNKLFFSYKKAPFFDEVFSFIENIMMEEYNTISELNCTTLKRVSEKLELKTYFAKASELNINDFELMSKEDKLDSIIEKELAEFILMPPGSLELYENWVPRSTCVKNTLTPRAIRYKQYSNEFVSDLSIIDVLMFNGFKNTSLFLKSNEGV
jgi:hypothetical protein